MRNEKPAPERNPVSVMWAVVKSLAARQNTAVRRRAQQKQKRLFETKTRWLVHVGDDVQERNVHEYYCVHVNPGVNKKLGVHLWEICRRTAQTVVYIRAVVPNLWSADHKRYSAHYQVARGSVINLVLNAIYWMKTMKSLWHSDIVHKSTVPSLCVIQKMVFGCKWVC